MTIFDGFRSEIELIWSTIMNISALKGVCNYYSSNQGTNCKANFTAIITINYVVHAWFKRTFILSFLDPDIIAIKNAGFSEKLCF